MDDQTKLKTVLNKILNGECKINEEQKLVFLENLQNQDFVKIFIRWMEETLLLWELEGATKEVLIFFIDILIEFSKDQKTFLLLHQNNTNKRIIKLIGSTKDSDITRSYIKFLDALTQTKFGKNWLCQTLDFWKNVFEVIDSQEYTDSLTIFLKDLFLSVVDESELFSIDLLNIVLQPLKAISSKISGNDLNDVQEEKLSLQLTPTINLLTSIITSISETITIDSQWLNHCSNFLEFQKPLTILLEIIENEEFTLTISKLLLSLNFLELKQYTTKLPQFVNLYIETTIKLLEVNIYREFLNNITHFSFLMQHYWYHICRLVDLSDVTSKLTYDLCISIIMFQTASISCLSIKIQGPKFRLNIEEDELRTYFESGIIPRLHRSMVDLMYKVRDLISVKKDCFINEVNLALDFLRKSFDMFHREGKILLFNYLLFFLGDVIEDIQKNKTVQTAIYDKSVVTNFINTFVFFAENCDLTWKDVVAHMLTLVTAADLLHVEDLPCDVVVAALKMLDLAIDKHMAPDLTLLMESNSMVSIVPLLERKLKSDKKVVRCAASKVLLTVSKSAKSNYPFFQKVLLENKLPQQLLNRVFLNKESAEIRIMLLKCLQHLIKIPSIWEEMSSNPDILDSIINALKTQNENPLRAELVNLVATIYEEDYFTDLQVQELYEIMTRLGVLDFYVGVRINTLKFWEVVIKKFLFEEGMIDGEFPEVTFSIQSKKIVVLSNEEIKRRLRRFMGRLSESGCLTVLNCCFNSKEDSEKLCVWGIVDRLLGILNKYGISQDNVVLKEVKTRRFIVDDLESELLTPKEFLVNVSQLPEIKVTQIVPKFVGILDEILGFSMDC